MRKGEGQRVSTVTQFVPTGQSCRLICGERHDCSHEHSKRRNKDGHYRIGSDEVISKDVRHGPGLGQIRFPVLTDDLQDITSGESPVSEGDAGRRSGSVGILHDKSMSENTSRREILSRRHPASLFDPGQNDTDMVLIE